jgi:hypothetical protein
LELTTIQVDLLGCGRRIAMICHDNATWRLFGGQGPFLGRCRHVIGIDLAGRLLLHGKGRYSIIFSGVRGAGLVLDLLLHGVLLFSVHGPLAAIGFKIINLDCVIAPS